MYSRRFFLESQAKIRGLAAEAKRAVQPQANPGDSDYIASTCVQIYQLIKLIRGRFLQPFGSDACAGVKNFALKRYA